LKKKRAFWKYGRLVIGTKGNIWPQCGFYFFHPYYGKMTKKQKKRKKFLEKFCTPSWVASTHIKKIKKRHV